MTVDNVKLDLPTMMKSKEKAVNGLTSGIEFLFKKNGVRGAFPRMPLPPPSLDGRLIAAPHHHPAGQVR
jgi:hypothetical protein